MGQYFTSVFGTKMDELKLNTILLVEDNEDDIILIRRLLDKTGIKINNILIARDIDDAIQIMKSDKNIDIVLLDLNLPSSKKIDTIKNVIHIPAFSGVIIVLTSIGDTNTQIEALKFTISDYLVKSDTDSLRLKRAIISALSRREIISKIKEANRQANQLAEIVKNINEYL